MLATMYGWQRYPGDTHYYGYNVPRLSRLLTEAGCARPSPARSPLTTTLLRSLA